MGTGPGPRPTIDRSWRPESYWSNERMDEQRLGRIKGTVRRQMVDNALRQGEPVLEEPIADQSLEPNDLRSWGRVHPAFMGGEYLPDLAQEEVEIARIELESVTADVISLRARQESGQIHYRLVDEYDTQFTVHPEHTDVPLTLREVIAMLETAASNDYVPDDDTTFIDAMRNHQLDAMEPREAVKFISVSSRVYSGLKSYFDAQAKQWEKRMSKPTRRG